MTVTTHTRAAWQIGGGAPGPVGPTATGPGPDRDEGLLLRWAPPLSGKTGSDCSIAPRRTDAHGPHPTSTHRSTDKEQE